MTMRPNPELDSVDPSGGPAPLAAKRPLHWSLRRELWENRSVYIAPLVVAGIVLFASSFSALGTASRMRSLSAVEAVTRHNAIVKPFHLAPAPIMLTTFLVGMFFSLDCLFGERRDRSILFWKSLPVSDRTVVLSKVIIPLLILPLIGLVLSVVTQFILLMLGTMALLVSGMSPAPMWTEVRFFQGLVIMFYGLAVHALWFAPIYGWLMLISGWARRMPLLWAVLPLLAISAVEKLAFGTSWFPLMLRYRVIGAMTEAFTVSASKGHVSRLDQLDPLRYLTSFGLWAGLVFAAGCFIAAARLRRNREPT